MLGEALSHNAARPYILTHVLELRSGNMTGLEFEWIRVRGEESRAGGNHLMGSANLERQKTVCESEAVLSGCCGDMVVIVIGISKSSC